MGVADVEAAGGGAGGEGVFEGEIQEKGEGETGVEMVAGTGEDFGFFDEGAGEFGGAIGIGGDGAFGGVDHDGVEAGAVADAGGEIGEGEIFGV